MHVVISPSRPERIATWILTAALVLVPLVHATLSDPFAFPKDIVVLAAALLLAGVGIASHVLDDSPPGLVSPALWLALAYLACAGIALLPATNRGLAFWGFLEIASGVTVLWGIARFVRQPRRVAVLLRAILLSASLVALGTLIQIAMPGFHLSVGGFSLLPASHGGSTLGETGLAAQVLLLALPAGVGAAAMGPGRWRIACGALLGLIAATLLYAGRPEAWIVGGAVLGLLALTRVLRAGLLGCWRDLIPDLAGDGLRAFLSGVVVVIAVIALSRWAAFLPAGQAVDPVAGVSLLSPTTGDPVEDRAAARRGTLALIARHPLGVGPDNWRNAFLEVAWTAVPKSPFTLSHQAAHAGDSFLEEAAETGVAGGLAFALLVTMLLAQAGIATLRAPEEWGAAGFAALNVLAVFGISALLGSPAQDPAPVLIFWVTAGVTQVALARCGAIPGRLGALTPRESPFVPRALRRRPAGVAAAAAWLAAVVALALLAADRTAALDLALSGQGAYYAGRYDAALRDLTQPPSRRSPDYLPRALAATSFLRLGHYENAAREFGAAIARSPFFVAAYLGRAGAYERLGRYDLAEQDLTRALGIWPGNPDGHLALAKLNATRGLLDAALEEHRKALQLNPTLAESYFLMGNIYLRRGQLDEAIEAFRSCLGKNPRYPRADLSLGEAFFRKGLPEMALRYFQAGASVDEKSVEARLLIANTNHAMGQYCEAKDALEAARDLETNPASRAGILDLIRKIGPECRKQMKARAARQ